jgi:hypothetical protein
MEVIVLMKPKYLKTKNSLMDKFPRFKGYVIANENYNTQLIDKANLIEWKTLKSLGYYQYEDMLFILKSMVNGEGAELGKYLIVLSKNTFKKYQDRQQNVSLLTRFSDDDIYNFVKDWEHPAGSYRNVSDSQLVKLYTSSSNTTVKEEIRDRLRGYSNDELINIILENMHKEEKVGVVE